MWQLELCQNLMNICLEMCSFCFQFYFLKKFLLATLKQGATTWRLMTRCQFHQHFKSSFFVPKSFEQLFCTYGLGFYFFCKRKLAQKLCVKCWWNWLLEFDANTTVPMLMLLYFTTICCCVEYKNASSMPI